MDQMRLTPIGKIENKDGEASIVLEKRYAPALAGLSGFSHVQVLWWFDICDNDRDRSVLVNKKPYVNGPDHMGTFATRSPQRPNPIALSTAQVVYLDEESARVHLAYIDAKDGTPVLDIKPYTPSLDRVEKPAVPDWCAHWPASAEVSGDFDWEAEFNF